jgi:hypothetical protein
MKENIYTDSTENEIIIAGGKVVHKTGGPEMILLGFIHPNTFGIFGNIKDELTSTQQQFLSPKICKNSENQFGFYKSLNETDFYGDTYYLKYWNGKGHYSKEGSFKCVCRYYSQKDEAFVYKVFNPSEIEFVVKAD